MKKNSKHIHHKFVTLVSSIDLEITRTKIEMSKSLKQMDKYVENTIKWKEYNSNHLALSVYLDKLRTTRNSILMAARNFYID